MKETFHLTLSGSPFDDPFLFVRILRERRALLFDLGDISCLEPKNILKISDIMVTHTHIDHFIGFDMMLRIALRKVEPLRIFGPEGIINCIEGKLRGYTWNLIRDYPLKIEAFEATDKYLRHSGFYAENAFERRDYPPLEFNGVLLNDSQFIVKGLVLSHQIKVLAFSLKENFHININKEVLKELNLPVGPWLSEFKKVLRSYYDPHKKELNPEGFSRPIEVNGSLYPLGELFPVAVITKGKQISYVMDISPADENIEKLIPFIRHSDHLFCEAYFLEKDRKRAIDRRHLTAADAGRIAKEAEVGNLTVTHFSPKYRNCPEDIYREAMGEYGL